MRIIQGQSNLSKAWNIVKDAKEKLIISSPYVMFPKHINNEIEMINRILIEKNVSIDIITLPDSIDVFKVFSKANLYALEDLHAKYYMNEENILITSQNFYKKSKNNRVFELGILYERNDDSNFDEVANKLLYVHESHIDCAKKIT
jgi:hypothetical protein